MSYTCEIHEKLRMSQTCPDCLDALIQALTGPEDRSLQWIGYVGTLVREYERTHDWVHDDDPSATAEAIDRIKTGVCAVEEALEGFGVSVSLSAELPAYVGTPPAPQEPQCSNRFAGQHS